MSRVSNLKEHGASVAKTPAAVVKKCKYTIGMLSDPLAALFVVFDKDGLLEEIRTGKGYIDMSAVDADTSSKIYEAVTNKGGLFLEAQVSGNKKPAEDDQLVILAAGEKIYDLTGVVSSLLFNGYCKLQSKEKLEWNNRGFSTFHAIIVSAASLYLLTLSDLFDDKSNKVVIIDRSSTTSDALLGISTGYFIADLSMILYYFPALGGMEYVFHHGISMFSILQSLLSGQGQIYVLMVLLSESTTPFVNLRWYLDVAGRKESKAYVINGLALFLGWLVARIILFGYFFYHVYTHLNQAKETYALGYYTLLIVPPVLAVMNIFWFWKICKGMIKALTRKGQKKPIIALTAR